MKQQIYLPDGDGCFKAIKKTMVTAGLKTGAMCSIIALLITVLVHQMSPAGLSPVLSSVVVVGLWVISYSQLIIAHLEISALYYLDDHQIKTKYILMVEAGQIQPIIAV